MPRSKYRAVPTEIDGIRFDSKREAERYAELKLLLASGDIIDLERQPKFINVVNGKSVCIYRADFQYYDCNLRHKVIEDVKGFKTPVYRLKKRLTEACHGITITEVANMPFNELVRERARSIAEGGHDERH